MPFFATENICRSNEEKFLLTIWKKLSHLEDYGKINSIHLY